MIPDWLKSDPIATRLIAMGWHSSEAFRVSERISIIMEGDRVDAYTAAERVLGWYPHSADVAEKRGGR